MLPGFEESTGIKVVTSSGASEGNWPKTIRCQLAHGATADVAILSREGLNILNEDGQIKQHSDAGLATKKWSGLFEQIFLIYKWKTCGVTLPREPLAAVR